MTALPTPTRIYYSHQDQFIYRHPDTRMRPLQHQLSELYRTTSEILQVTPSVQERRDFTFSATRWDHDFLFWHLITRPSYHSYGHYGHSWHGFNSFSGGGSGCTDDDGKACLVVVIITLIASMLIGFGFASHATYKEGKASQKSHIAKKEILKIGHQLQINRPSTKGLPPDLTNIHTNLRTIASYLERDANHKTINTALGTIGTAGIGLLIAALVGYLLHLYDIPTQMPLDILGIAGGSAISISLLALAINYSCKNFDKTEIRNSWQVILNYMAALPSQAIANLAPLYRAWSENPGSKLYMENSANRPGQYSYFTIESDEQNQADKVAINFYESDRPLAFLGFELVTKTS